MKIEVNWRGKIGYGDILSPISYAYNIADKNCCDVDLNFFWEEKKGTKFKESDPETLQHRVAILERALVQPHKHIVKVRNFYETPWDSARFGDPNHTNYLDDGPLHNLRLAKQPYGNIVRKQICLCTTVRNREHFWEYDKSKLWKDPIGTSSYSTGGKWNAWIGVEQRLARYGWDTVHIDYDTPLKDALYRLSTSYCTIGYHGGALWLATMMGTPIIVFSKSNISDTAFPWSIRYTQWGDFNIEDLPRLREKSLRKKEQVLHEYRQYLCRPNFHRL